MQVLTMQQVDAVSGAVSDDAVYGAAVGAGIGFLAIGLTITAPVWGTAFLLGASMASSAIAINSLMH